MTENNFPAKGSIVRIGKGANVWQIIHVSPTGDAIIVAMTRQISGGYERARYTPGRQARRVEKIERLAVVAA